MPNKPNLKADPKIIFIVLLFLVFWILFLTLKVAHGGDNAGRKLSLGSPHAGQRHGYAAVNGSVNNVTRSGNFQVFTVILQPNDSLTVAGATSDDGVPKERVPIVGNISRQLSSTGIVISYLKLRQLVRRGFLNSNPYHNRRLAKRLSTQVQASEDGPEKIKM